MRCRRLAILTIGATLVAGPAWPDPESAGRGRQAPPFQGLRLDGSPFDSSELVGSFVLLDFWGVWCPPCIAAFPKLSRLHEEHAERGFRVVGLAVLSGTPEEVAAFVDEHDVTYPIVVVERAVPKLFDVLAFPSYFLLGPDGEILRAYQGQPSDLYEVVSEDLERFLPDRRTPAGRLDTPNPPG